MKELNGFPDYFITEDGRTYSTRTGKLKELKQHLHAEGRYKFVTLRNKNGERKHKSIHRLVAETYIPNPHNLPQVNHIDEDRFNNNVNNLEWVTASQNQRHSAHKHKRCNISKRAKFYTLENKNGERFEVFNLNKWCQDNKMYRSALSETYTGTRRKWYKNHRVVKVLEV